MKTAISIPDDLFQSADALAEELGVSRSELYARAVAEYLAKHRHALVTARLNASTPMPPTGWIRRFGGSAGAGARGSTYRVVGQRREVGGRISTRLGDRCRDFADPH